MKVSFLIPTYHAARFLPACLKSIRGQDYPQDQIEIIVVDGGSNDATVSIARDFEAQVMILPGCSAEEGKLIALKASSGDVFVFMDADNEIMGEDWLQTSLDALQSSSGNLLGVEAFYPSHPEDGSLNQYLTTLLHINDPIAYKMAAPLIQVDETSRWKIFEIQPPYNFPTGANGFMFLRSTILKVFQESDFHESEWSRKLIQMGYRRIAMVKGMGVYHHYVRGLGDLWRKRRHAGVLYLKRQHSYGSTWFLARGKRRLVLVCLWYALILPALIEALFKSFRDRSVAWLWHPIIGWFALVNHGTTFLRDQWGSLKKRGRPI
jgi:glycosyltransferase involved in cell wall biosynthesis